jgi:citrate lyase subunit beta/citryl-CoA lyase
MTPRTFLYVPGDQPERLAKSGQRGADAVVVDLEDAVLPGAKAEALENAEAWLRNRDPHQTSAWVRINGGDRGVEEVRVLAGAPGLMGFFIPKVESAEQIEAVACAASRSGFEQPLLAPLIESAAGVVLVEELAQVPGVSQLHLGEVDLVTDLDLEPSASELELLYVRSRVVVASRYAGLPPPAALVSATIDDQDAFRAGTEALKRLGFFGRACIHPVQVSIAAEVFTPSPEAQAWARSLLDRAGTAPEPSATLTGQWPMRPWFGGRTASSNDRSSSVSECGSSLDSVRADERSRLTALGAPPFTGGAPRTPTPVFKPSRRSGQNLGDRSWGQVAGRSRTGRIATRQQKRPFAGVF